MNFIYFLELAHPRNFSETPLMNHMIYLNFNMKRIEFFFRVSLQNFPWVSKSIEVDDVNCQAVRVKLWCRKNLVSSLSRKHVFVLTLHSVTLYLYKNLAIYKARNCQENIREVGKSSLLRACEYDVSRWRSSSWTGQIYIILKDTNKINGLCLSYSHIFLSYFFSSCRQGYD